MAITMAAILVVASSADGQGTSPRLSSSQSTEMNRGRTMVYEGFTEPRQDILVAASEVGRMESISVEVGDLVSSGDVIGKLEDAMQRSAVDIARLQTETTGELGVAEAGVELSQSRAVTLRQLADDGMARPDELARAEIDLRISVARRDTVLEQHQLRLAELRRAELQVERRKVRAPVDGVVSEVFREVGEYIAPNDPAVIRLLVMDKLFAVFNVPVEDTNSIAVDTPVRVYLRSSARNINAKITSIAPNIDGESGTVRVRIELDNAQNRLLSGDRCTLHLRVMKGISSARMRPAPQQSGAVTR